jgi:transcription elongation factor GreA
MTDEKEYLSKDKLIELKKELEYLSTTKRREIAVNLEQAKALGDLRENSEYQEARAAQASLEERIANLSFILKRAVVVDVHHTNKVEIGSTVILRKLADKEEMKLTLVGSSEAHIGAGKISNESPIGRAMMGKTRGDKFTVTTARGKMDYEIAGIE